ncbi:MAG: hypothetical protein A2086_15895 [Spirochaetes bacterium GWD1_27_9]|nr:MAG: hypothetical protein A2Z98_11165 [Spirochaetes bacterium GWB1_27_13]OHD24816.1 MAG: hypothetical protein A2Y34_08275 [Spirochaetes bacterium GWC1_27_15]OHD42861.1 MAG: hypothetical protein A2086_15895 [Spirochaetes bacterium GWD1_27_9]
MAQFKLPLGQIGLALEFYKVMIIEDSKTVRLMLKQILLSEKFNLIIEAENGIDAIQKLQNAPEKPDIIFSDVDMPGMNGIEAVAEIKKIDPKIKIVMATSHKDEDTVKKLLNLGISGYIVKPFDRQQVLEKIAKIVGRDDYLPKFIS